MDDDDFMMKNEEADREGHLHELHRAYPVDSRSEVNAHNSLNSMRDRKIKLLYGDNAFDNSFPNRKHTNAIVERTNLHLEKWH